jgi:hypothetical protein
LFFPKGLKPEEPLRHPAELPERKKMLNKRKVLVRHKGQQSNHSRPFNGHGKGPLVFCTGSGNTAGKDFSAFGYKAAEYIRILIIDLQLLNAEFADLLFKENFAFAAPGTFTVPSVIHTPVLPGKTLILFYISLV